MTSEDRINAFLEGWHRRDLDALVAALAPDAVFQPDPKSTPVVGRAAIGALWAKYLETIESYDATVHAMIGDARRVFVERTERMGLSGGRSMTLPIVGIFELNDAGEISAWRDYWDTAMAAPA